MNSPPPDHKPVHDIMPSFDIGLQERQKKIELAAYLKAEARGFAPGHELDDWLEAEREVDEAMRPLPSY